MLHGLVSAGIVQHCSTLLTRHTILYILYILKLFRIEIYNAKHHFPALRHLSHMPTCAQRHLAYIVASKRTQSTQLASPVKARNLNLV